MARKTIALDLHVEGSRPTLQVNSTGVEASNVISPKGGTLLYLVATNPGNGAAYAQVFDAAAVPADGAVPLLSIKLGAGESYQLLTPVCCSDGIVVAASTTAGYLTHDAGTKQSEVATIVVPTTITLAGQATVTLTTALVPSPIVLTVTLAQGLIAKEVGGLIGGALAANAQVAAHFDVVAGGDAFVTLTAKIAAANDATLNLSVIKAVSGGCTGLTNDTSSDTGNAGVAPSVACMFYAIARVG